MRYFKRVEYTDDSTFVTNESMSEGAYSWEFKFHKLKPEEITYLKNEQNYTEITEEEMLLDMI